MPDPLCRGEAARAQQSDRIGLEAGTLAGRLMRHERFHARNEPITLKAESSADDASQQQCPQTLRAPSIVNLREPHDSGVLAAGSVGGRTTMLRRVIGAGALILAMSSQVQAASEPGLAQRISCSEVRYYVEKYTAAVAEMYARSHGATEAQIDRARRCLAGSIYRRAERWRTYTE